MSQYGNGTKLEYALRDYFEMVYGMTVVRSAGSRGAIDLVAFNEESMFVVQCKRQGKSKSYEKDERRLLKVRVPRGIGFKLLAVHDTRKGVVELRNMYGGVTELTVKELKEFSRQAALRRKKHAVA